MPYRYVDDATTADVAFEAYGETLEGLLCEAWSATVGLMVEDPARLKKQERRQITVESEDPEMLLFELLGELLYYKDAEGILLDLQACELERHGERCRFSATAQGERIDPGRQRLGVDIKAVTLHQFYLRQIEEGWEARVVLDT